ncbi:MAG TPA: hypothetical protein VEJ36_02780 [Nitrososphaerales archaeon]|nr:hypothetical protein [Nitrososphaerales archaeon]
MSSPQTSTPDKKRGKLWFLIVLLVALGLGALSTLASVTPEEPPGRRFPPFQFSARPLLQFHTFLTTMEVVFLVALVTVYVKVYADTRARFSLGLVCVLLALLLNTILSYPLVLILAGPIGLGPGSFLPFADILEVGAYILFLYLSLE